MKRFISMMVATTASLLVSTSAFSAGGPLAGDDDTSTTTGPLMKVHLTAGGVDTYRQSEIAYITFTPAPVEVPHEYVDLGLPSGTLWATTNVGANSPTEYGDYFAWGETTPKSKDSYTWDTYFDAYDGSGYSFKKYTWEEGGKSVLDPEDDAAYVNWGPEWRMPSVEQVQELYNGDYTTAWWTSVDGVYGHKITSKVNGNSIFIPAAGFYDNGGGGDYNQGACWTRDLHPAEYNGRFACYHYFVHSTDPYSSSENVYSHGLRFWGIVVRPVRANN